ncbi:G- -signaling modulator 1 isoform X2 [Brachionus plicatilis]|uniref:G--signaling modulator 1 isoform X2 n=1 Tax=Brachionus plicatilis TaxID=10195 RepID=A0A3M7PUH1_BRAPC|nr:G- -signaling modulator 1 isoform X2 [Brachionus plicatilis]
MITDDMIKKLVVFELNSHIKLLSSLVKKSESIDSVYQSHQNLCIQKPPVANRDSKDESNESFFDILAKIQSNRLDDQRSSLRIKTKPKSENRHKENKTDMDDEFFNLVMKSQRSRLEDQRSSIAISNNGTKFVKVRTNDRLTVPPDDEFFSMLQKLQSRRLNEQRCVPK